MGEYNRVIIISVIVGVVSLGIGVLIGYFANQPPEWVSTVESLQSDLEESTLDRYIRDVKTDNIKDNLREFARYPHLAATTADEDLVNIIRDLWLEQLDGAYITNHDVLLSYPNPDDVNSATVVDDSGTKVFQTAFMEDVLTGMERPEDIVQYYNAYSPSGQVQGGLVFANHGTEDDFKALSDMGIDLNGAIALTKYGGTGRGARTYNAKPYGIIGVLVYSDPEDYVVEGEKGYPDDWSLPPTGVQRGSTLSEFGDPTTPYYPSIKSAYRIPKDELDVLPALPLTPINYKDAGTLLEMLGGKNAPESFTSGLVDQDDLKVGPGFVNTTHSLKLNVNASLEYRTSHNVIGVIRGSDEPESYVLYGNHRDSWVYGAVDPTSGTSCMMEMTRVLGKMLQDGWRPKRSIVFGSWGSEEFGLIGSTEWGEENAFIFEGRAVTYINVDIAVFANETFFARASPIMKRVLMEAADRVEDPSGVSVLENWISYHPDSETEGMPSIKRLYTSSDYAYFYQTLGISCADLSFRGNTSNPRYQISPYPTYHTGYDTFDYVDRFLDPGFLSHTAVARVAGTALLLISDSLIVPYDARDFADYILYQIAQTDTTYGAKMVARGLSLDNLKEAGIGLAGNATALHEFIDIELDRKNPYEVKRINSKLMAMERSFIEPRSLPGQQYLRHVSGSPPNHDNNSEAFPSIVDAMYNIEDDDEEAWIVVEQQLAMITYRINNAAKLLTMDDAFV